MRGAWVVVGVALGCWATAGGAAEKWADPRLDVLDGVQLWLDAGHAYGPEIRPQDGRLAVWWDASGRGRHVRAAQPEFRPQLLPVGDTNIVRFDGADDHLRAVKQAAKLESFTLFVVAAPRRNRGLFRAFCAFNAPDRRDYQSGLNLDLGPGGTPDFSVLNAEGPGFGGALNLRTAKSSFGELAVLELASSAPAKEVVLTVDGRAEGRRPREPAPLALDEITIGARFYNNGPGPQHVDGHGACDLAELLLYDRALDAAETARVRKYLLDKYAAVRAKLPPAGDGPGDALVPVAAPPAVQTFPPGFAAFELPLDLTNVNNIRYRADGTLVALAYDGKVWKLTDRDGDGLEDHADLFWDNRTGLRAPIGMDLTPPGYAHGDGLFVVGKTRCVLIVDTDHDGRADKEIEVAGGWKESFHSVDGLGVAFDPRDGSVYFGRGTYNFSDPLLRDKEGRAQYKLSDEGSTVLRVAPDFKSREIVATGVRFPVALRFNRHGDLFATDQEGATWVPNGNPFDELLHIQKGRHYGFPARHPRDLPQVIDEPSTFDYAPQHQSTCGLNFNEPVRPDGPVFGPATWRGDAFVTGYSRGKLYRTQLVKTPVGYVARTSLFGSLPMLAVDACISPDGSLVVACHGGGPDWGSGPIGKGKLFKVRYVDREHAQPTLVWASGPREVRVEFDRPVDPEHLRDLLSSTKLTAGEFVRAGDRFEKLWPGYAVVDLQKNSPRRNVPIHSAQLTPDRRSLVLAVEPLAGAVSYALELPGMGRPVPRDVAESPQNAAANQAVTPNQRPAPIAQHAAIDLDFDLTGCEAIWTPLDAGQTPWHGWLPHLDLAVARELTRGSAPHEALWRALDAGGELTVHTRLDLSNMLRPVVQPGSQIDYELPAEEVRAKLTAAGSQLNVTSVSSGRVERESDSTSSIIVAAKDAKSVVVEVRVRSTGRAPELAASWTTAEDSRARPFPLRRLLSPWVDVTHKPGAPATLVRAKELEGGDWGRGRKEFFSQDAACGKCHSIHGQGGSIGPDLSNLVHRDYASVWRDVTNPSFAINPDHLSYSVELKSGRVLSGVVRTQGDKLLVGDNKGALTEIAREDVAELKPLAVSTMPDGLAKQIPPERMRDLLTFLLTPPPSMPRDYPGPRPKSRTVAEVHEILAGAPTPPEPIRPLRVVLVAGPKDHGPGEHDYPAWQKAWKQLFSVAEKTTVEEAWEWPTAEQFRTADVLVFYQHGDFNDERAAQFDAFLERGGGAVYVHWAIDGRAFGKQMSERTGLAALGGVGFRHGDMTLRFHQEVAHPVTRNFKSLALVDETYWKMYGALPKNRILGTAVEEGEAQPQLWSVEPRKGRVFVSIPGHYSWTFDDPLFRILILRAIAWTAREPVDRFNDLVWPGAAVAK